MGRSGEDNNTENDNKMPCRGAPDQGAPSALPGVLRGVWWACSSVGGKPCSVVGLATYVPRKARA